MRLEEHCRGKTACCIYRRKRGMQKSWWMVVTGSRKAANMEKN